MLERSTLIKLKKHGTYGRRQPKIDLTTTTKCSNKITINKMLKNSSVASGNLADLRLPQVGKNKKIIYSWSLVVTLWRAPRARVH